MNTKATGRPSRILVVGGTGKVGSHLVPLLLGREQHVRVLVHEPSRASLVPSGAVVWIGNVIEDPDAVRAAFDGVDAVFMLNAVSPHETVEGLLLVSMARAAGVRHFVYQSTHSLSHLKAIPHLGSKFAITQAVEASGMPYTVISPNFFFQSDDDGLASLNHYGTYPNPFGDVGCWRVDVRDIAEVAAIVLTSDGHVGKNYALVGPENLTASDCARKWEAVLNRPIRVSGDIDEWKAAVGPYLPSWLVEDLAQMYTHIAEHGMLGSADEVDTVTALLGRAPRRYDDYLAECAARFDGAVS